MDSLKSIREIRTHYDFISDSDWTIILENYLENKFFKLMNFDINDFISYIDVCIEFSTILKDTDTIELR